MQINSINSVNSASPNFTRCCDKKEKGGAGKAWCSFFIPGLGQFLDGRNAAGAGFLGGCLGLSAASSILYTQSFKPVINHIEYVDQLKATQNSKEFFSVLLKNKKFVGAAAVAMALVALRIVSIVDAYKGGKNKSEKTCCNNEIKEINKRLDRLEEEQELKAYDMCDA